MWANTEVVGWKTSPEAGNAFTGHRLGKAVGHTTVGHLAASIRLLLLHLSLDVVEGKGEESSAECGQHGGLDLDGSRGGGLVSSLRNLLLGGLV